jgi:uncharacterized protein YbjT (DUF2867 family)
MRVFVTGGSGIMGGYVLRAFLTAGHEVTNYSRKFAAAVLGADADVLSRDAAARASLRLCDSGIS